MFLNAIMLAGLAGAAVPLVLHLLSRARYKSVDWGAMMFLAGTEQRQRQSTRLKQWILLAMRMAIVALIAMAMARPVVTGFLRNLTPGGHVDAVILIDASSSMAVEENGKARMELARRAAINIIAQLQRGDRVALLPAGRAHDLPAFSSDLQAVAQAAAMLTPGDGKNDIGLALAEAAGVLEAAQGLNREVYIIADRQVLNWSQVNETFATAWDRRWDNAPAKPKLFYVPVGGEERANVAIDSINAFGLPAVAKQPIELEIRVRNYGPEPQGDVPLTLSDGQKELYRTSVTLPPEASAVVRTTVAFDEPGCPVLTAKIGTRSIALDDQRELSVLVAPPIEVLVISGDEREGLFRKESDFLRLALAPWAGSGEQGPDPTKVTIIPAAKWQRPDPRKHPVVVLANVSSLTEAQAHDLEQYVYSGGGLLITMGNLVQSEHYNRLLYRNGSGIQPLWLGDSMSAQGTQPQTIIGVELNHPMFRFLRGKPDPVPNVSINRHVPSYGPTSAARTLITLSGGTPLLTEQPAGRGRVLLLTTTVDADWTTLPLSGSYLPLMQSMVRYLASAQLPAMNVRQGEPIALNVEQIAEEGAPKITLPDGKQDVMEVRPSVLSAELRYGKTQSSGRYAVKLKPAKDAKEQGWTFVVQRPAEESDLTPFAEKDLRNWRKLLDMEVLDPRTDEMAGAVGRHRSGKELWLPLLLAALALMGVEMWFARWCSVTRG